MLHQSQKLLRSALRAFALAASLPLVLTGCQDEEFGYDAESIRYAKTYEDFFGEIPADKSWDLSSYTKSYNPDEEEDYSGTRSIGDGKLDLNEEYKIADKYWEIPQKTLQWMEKALIEGKDNRYLGSNFVLQLPANDFAIVPIYQGRSSINSELEVKINGYDIKSVWGRSENILVNDRFLTSSTELASLKKPEDITDADIAELTNAAKDGKWHKIGYYNGWKSVNKADAERGGEYECSMYPSFTDLAKRIVSKPIYFNSKTAIAKSDHGFMYLSLYNNDKAWASWTNFNERWDEGNVWTTIGHRLTSINPEGHMLALNMPWDARPTPDELPDISSDGSKPSQVLMIACEDANGSKSDHDVNDVVFLIIGYPDVPTVVPTKEVIKKRYMCEDLGGTFDFDFNDIVVDVTQTQEWAIDAQPNTIDDPTQSDNITIKEMRKVGCPVQTAKISRVCGTIPIQVQIGTYVFPKIYDPTDLYDTRVNLAGNGYDNAPQTLCDGSCTHVAGCGCEHVSTAPKTRGHDDKIGWNPNEERVLPCHPWKPEENNIVIWADWAYDRNWHTVNKGWEDKHGNNTMPLPYTEGTQDWTDWYHGKKTAVSFPEKGAYPFIIATDQTVPWMNECQTIPNEWVHGDLSARGDNDFIGNSFYMEGYPAPEGEGYIWSGDVTGLAYSTGITFKPNTAEMEAVKEATSGAHLYYLLNVYVQSPAGEVGRIGILDGNWEPLTGTEADGYLAVSPRLHDTRSSEVNGLDCVSIYLTKTQIDAITERGLTITSRNNGLVIRKVTMSRPCKYKSAGENGVSDINGTEVDRNGNYGQVYIDNGFTVKITAPADPATGTIRANNWERWENIIVAPEGQSLSSADIAHNNAEPARACIPFSSARFISGTRVELTAIGKPGYKLDYWTLNGTNKTENPLVLESNSYPSGNDYNDNTETTFNVSAVFRPAQNPNLEFTDNDDSKLTTSKEITIIKGHTQRVDLTSANNSGIIGTNGANTEIVTLSAPSSNHYIDVTGNTVGKTEFIIYQQDAGEYGVSGELKLSVKVIEVADAQIDLVPAMFHTWSGTGSTAYITTYQSGSQVGNHINPTTSDTNARTIGSWLGDENKNCYADLTSADVMIVRARNTSADPEFVFNEYSDVSVAANPDNSNKKYVTKVADGSDNVYIVDLAAIRSEKGMTHLNAIWRFGQSLDIKSVKLDKYECEAETTYAMLTSQISWNETLKASMHHIWNSGEAIANITGEDNTFQYTTSKDVEIIYGSSNNVFPNTNYSDLSSANWMKVTLGDPCSSNPRFFFNDNITLEKADAIVIGNVWYFDLKKFKQSHDGYAHLRGIKGQYGQKANIVKIELDNYSCKAEMDYITNNLYKEDGVTWTELTSTNYIDSNSGGSGYFTASPTGNGDGSSPSNPVCGYGNNSIHAYTYADLSDKSVLKVVTTSTSGKPMFCFNKEFVETDQWGRANHCLKIVLDENHLYDNPYIRPQVNSAGKFVYYINLSAIKADYGEVHLNAIVKADGEANPLVLLDTESPYDQTTAKVVVR